ncbi:MAG: hypothetical protein DMG13_08525 [Acidobacteria bacterium]|nr:MAG: hypothetical protein DMG13_08525 [Acidobacteriota bacterium]
MVGKMVLPHLGGAAAVWTTCVLFFQAMLLAGYVYAHLLGRASDVRKQILTHALVLLLPLAFLPMVFRGDSSGSSSQHPSLWLMLRLLTSAGVPLFVVSATAPLLQNWLSRTKDMAARDPYFLYAASNTGSLLALIAYPSLLEPRVGVVWRLSWIIGLDRAGIGAGVAAQRETTDTKASGTGPSDPG